MTSFLYLSLLLYLFTYSHSPCTEDMWNNSSDLLSCASDMKPHLSDLRQVNFRLFKKKNTQTFVYLRVTLYFMNSLYAGGKNKFSCDYDGIC